MTVPFSECIPKLGINAEPQFSVWRLLNEHERDSKEHGGAQREHIDELSVGSRGRRRGLSQ